MSDGSFPAIAHSLNIAFQYLLSAGKNGLHYKAKYHIEHRRTGGSYKGIRQLRFNVREQVSSDRHGGENCGVGERRAVIAEDTTGHHSANCQQDIGVHGHSHRNGNGHHNREGAPAGTCAEGHHGTHQEDNSRAEGTADGVAHQACQKLAGAHPLDHTANGKGQDQQDHQPHHAANTLHHAVAKLLGGHDPLLGIHDAHDQQRDGNHLTVNQYLCRKPEDCLAMD